MLPLGPKPLELNSTSAVAGMSLFFTLSGFLITTNLLKHPDIINFIIRRGCRILPLAFVGILVYMIVQAKSWPYYLAQFLFVENYADQFLTPLTGHFWSLCVEVHFYTFMALLVALVGVAGLRALPVLALMVTALRVAQGIPISIMTHYRVDEILAGSILALPSAGKLGKAGRGWALVMNRIPLWVWIGLLLLSAHPKASVFQYPRPYFGSAAVGHTLLSGSDSWWWPRNRLMRYIAEISFALYVIHPLSMAAWLGSGNTLVKYMKRPLSFAITVGLAHLSTFHMERHFIAWGKVLTHHRETSRNSTKTAQALHESDCAVRRSSALAPFNNGLQTEGGEK